MADRAAEYLESAATYRELVRELHETHGSSFGRVTADDIKRASADCGFALKAAEVCATLAVAEAIRSSAPSPLEPVEYLRGM